jgi:hypothetical protein
MSEAITADEVPAAAEPRELQIELQRVFNRAALASLSRMVLDTLYSASEGPGVRVLVKAPQRSP